MQEQISTSLRKRESRPSLLTYREVPQQPFILQNIKLSVFLTLIIVIIIFLTLISNQQKRQQDVLSGEQSHESGNDIENQHSSDKAIEVNGPVREGEKQLHFIQEEAVRKDSVPLIPSFITVTRQSIILRQEKEHEHEDEEDAEDAEDGRNLGLINKLKEVKRNFLIAVKEGNEDITLPEGMYQIQNLSVKKHRKFTSPDFMREGESGRDDGLGIKFWNYLFPSISRDVNDAGFPPKIDKIFQKGNNDTWVADGRYLTFHSITPISPKAFLITLPSFSQRRQQQQQQQQQPSQIYIFGIWAYDTIITNERTLESVLLIKEKVPRQSLITVFCMRRECAHQYSMIMLVMTGGVQIDGISVLGFDGHEI